MLLGAGSAAQAPVPHARTAIIEADDARVSTTAQRSVIEAALASGVPDVQVAALRAIGRTQRAEWLPRAVAALANPSLDVRREAAFAIAHIGSGAPEALATARQALGNALGRETDMLVCAALAEEYGRLPFPTDAEIDDAARTLRALIARLGGPGTAPPIVELGVARGAEALARRAARIEADRVRESGVGSRGSGGGSGESGVGGRGAGVGSRESGVGSGESGAGPERRPGGELADLLGSFYDERRVASDTPRDVLRARMRRLAVSGLLSMDRLTPALADRAVTDADAQVRRLGVMALSRQASMTGGAVGHLRATRFGAQGERALPSRARGWLGDSAVIVRHAVASRIGPTLTEVAEAAASDAHINVRLAALDALGEAAACRATCVARLDRPDAFGQAWHEAAHALVAFARTDPDAARAHVVRAADAGTWQARMYAARAARHTRQADVIARLAGDGDVNVRHAALQAWREARLPGLTAAAVDALGSDDGQLVLEAATAVGTGAGERVSGDGDRVSGIGERVTGTGGRVSGDGERGAGTGGRVSAAGEAGVAAGLVPRETAGSTSDVAAGLVPRETAGSTSDVAAGPVPRETAGSTSDVAAGLVPRETAGSTSDVAAGPVPRETAGSTSDVAAGLVPRTIPRADIVAALRATLARLTAQRRDTSRDPRVALIERIAELDPERATTLRPYLEDFDPFVAARVDALLRAEGRAGSPSPAEGGSGSPPARRSLGDGGAVHVPTWEEVERLGATTLALTLRGNRRLVLRLYAEQAPTAVARLVAQVRAGEWNGRTFHRVEPGFVVQGGSPAANEYAGAAAFTRDEFTALSHVRGTVGISTRGPDTGDGQIFINLVDNARLDYAYTIIGAITGDTSILDDIVEGEVIVEATLVGYVAAGLVRPPDRRTSPAATHQAALTRRTSPATTDRAGAVRRTSILDDVVEGEVIVEATLVGYVAAGLVRPPDRRTSPAATHQAALTRRTSPAATDRARVVRRTSPAATDPRARDTDRAAGTYRAP